MVDLNASTLTETTAARQPALVQGRFLIEPVCWGVFFFYLTSSVVFFGAWFGLTFLKDSRVRKTAFDGGSGPFYVNWDGQWYLNVVKDGYMFNRNEYSNVNFFPAYPLLAKVVGAAGMSPEVGLLVTSNLCLLATFVVLSLYSAGSRSTGGSDPTGFVLLSLGLAPPSFFFRMAYSESFFLLTTVLVLYGMRRRWPLFAIALVVGLATAVRPVGVALLPALAYHVWERYPIPREFALRTARLIPVACWGVAAYATYLGIRFGEPTAFIQSHSNWDRHPGASLAQKAWGLLTFRPYWDRFDPDSTAYWVAHDGQTMPLASLYLADPFYFLLAVVLVTVGARKGWLSIIETLTAVGLIVMPFAFKAYETDMEGFGRYACANVPVFLVAGRLLSRSPSAVAAGLMALSAVTLAFYSSLFSKWYVMF